MAAIHGTLKANKVKTVGLDAYSEFVNLVNRSQVDTIWFTVDGTVPVIGGGGTEYQCTDTAHVPTVDQTAIVLVRMVSASPVAYSVWSDVAPNPEELSQQAATMTERDG
jgi:hypothetical protein